MSKAHTAYVVGDRLTRSRASCKVPGRLRKITVQEHASSKSLSPLTAEIRNGLRRAGPTDAAAVRDLVRLAYAKWIPVLGREPKPMTADYDMAVRDHTVGVLYVDGEPVALIEMTSEPDHLLVVNVAVLPKHQGRGYGRALLAHAEEIAQSFGLNELRLYTSVHLTENVRLYERVGYRIDREKEASPKLGVFVYMSKHLH